jgi:hypothetical protein
MLHYLANGGISVATNEEKNEMLVMVLIDLAGICRKLEENSAVPAELRTQAGKYAAEFDVLLPHRGKGTPIQHDQGEALLTKIARFLPRLLEVQAKPAFLEEDIA